MHKKHMKSSRRKKYLEMKSKKKKDNKSFYWLILAIVFLSSIYLFLKISTEVWNGKDKVSVVYRKSGGDVGVSVINPVFSEVTNLIIPADTEVDVARNYGTFLIENVWQFGVNEKIGGNLLAETVTQNFLFPTFLWCEKDPGFDTGSFKSIANFIFLPGTTNMKFGDRLKTGLFVLRTKDLGESRFLDRERLEDGSLGYTIADRISGRLTAYFSDNDFTEETIKINIIDATGNYGVSDKLGEILEVLGGKVVSVDRKTDEEDSDCEVFAKDPILSAKIARFFSCTVNEKESPFDLTIKIGSEFADRF